MKFRLLFVLLAACVLAACTSTTEKESGASVEDHSTTTTTEGGATAGGGGAQGQTYGAGEQAGGKFSELNQPGSILSQRTIYFDFDSSNVKPEFQQLVEAHAQYLTNHPDVTVSLEGHTDERGSREYNLALGERRAKAVKEQMVLLGVKPEQLRVVSYGEERPAVQGHTEAAWSKNRRVEIVY